MNATKTPLNEIMPRVIYTLLLIGLMFGLSYHFSDPKLMFGLIPVIGLFLMISRVHYDALEAGSQNTKK